LFMAWRVTVMPFKNIELGFSRTAQFCGKQLECNLNVFGNLLAGNDNVGIDATPQNEPGNQMAGFDIRMASPIGNLPYALYGQYIGEDESGYLPAKYLGQIGVESWYARPDGGVVQIYAEWADTTCSATSSRGPYFNCAYNQGRFNVEGYRYLGRVIGHTTDRDSRSLAVGISFVSADGQWWGITARQAALNRDGNLDLVNSVTTRRTDYGAFEFSWRGHVAGQSLEAQVGAESIKRTGAEQSLSAFGFVRWTHDFAL
jgi:Capsule assembly protein Wzi